LKDYTFVKKACTRYQIKLFGEEPPKTGDSSEGVTQYSPGDHTSALESHRRAGDVRINVFGEECAETMKVSI